MTAFENLTAAVGGFEKATTDLGARLIAISTWISEHKEGMSAEEVATVVARIAPITTNLNAMGRDLENPIPPLPPVEPLPPIARRAGSQPGQPPRR